MLNGFFLSEQAVLHWRNEAELTPLTPLMACCQGFLFGPGPESRKHGARNRSLMRTGHHLHHYTSCVWFRNPQLRWPLSQPLSSRMQIRRLSAVQFIRHVTQHVIDLTFTWVPVYLYWEKHAKQRGCWVLDTAMGFSRTVSSKDV